MDISHEQTTNHLAALRALLDDPLHDDEIEDLLPLIFEHDEDLSPYDDWRAQSEVLLAIWRTISEEVFLSIHDESNEQWWDGDGLTYFLESEGLPHGTDLWVGKYGDDEDLWERVGEHQREWADSLIEYDHSGQLQNDHTVKCFDSYGLEERKSIVDYAIEEHTI